MLRQQQPLYELAGYRQPPCALLSKPAPDRPPFAAEPLQQQQQQQQPQGPGGGGKGGGGGDAKSEQQQLRRKINSRERKRMQDLNLAMDALREVILPYSTAHCQSSPGRKLSKIATLLLARNYILLLGSSLQELRRILGEMSGSGPRLLLAGLPLFAGPAPLLLAHHPHPDSLRPAGKYLSVALDEQQRGPLHLPAGAAAASLCPCAGCKFAPCLPAGLGVAAVQAQFAK